MKNIAVKNGFSVMTEDELYEVNGGKQIPATSFPEMGKDGYTGEQYIMPDDHSDTIYTGKPTYTEGSADLEHGTHGVYDTETKTYLKKLGLPEDTKEEEANNAVLFSTAHYIQSIVVKMQKDLILKYLEAKSHGQAVENT